MNRYSFNVFWHEPDNAYFAICPEFPGLSASGDTPEEALAEAKIGLQLMIDLYNEEGWALPEVKTQSTYSGKFPLRMPKGLHAQLAARAEAEEVSLNTLIVNLLSEDIGTMQGISPLQNALDRALQTIRTLTLVGMSRAVEPAQTISSELTVPNVTLYVGSSTIKATPLQ
jgi:predicted RNase H-like HicB family nuclease